MRTATNPGASVNYGAEKLTNYEIGTKNTFAEGRATLNLIGFWEAWKGIQLSVECPSPSVCPNPGSFAIQNAGKARSRGAELELIIRPIQGLTISSAASYTDATLRQDYRTVAPKGERLPFTPRFKANLVGRYEFPVGANKAHIQLAEVYQSSAWNNFETSNRLKYGKRNPYGVTDVTAGFAWNSMTFEIYASNLFDARGITAKGNGCGVSICDPDRYVVYNQPRLIGVRFGQRF